MSDVYLVKEKMHKMRAKLYPSCLPGTEGKFIARTVNESAATIEDICAAAKNRGGYDGSYEEMVKAVRHFLKETAYQLADGFSANLDFFTIHPNIGGVFHSDNEAHDHKDHPITFRFHELKPMRDLRSLIEVIIDGAADTKGYIMDFTDITTGAVNDTFTNMGMFMITGYKLKVEGGHPDVGVYFEQVGGPVTLKAGKLGENTSSKLIGVFPPGPLGTFKIIIKTQFSGGGNLLKEVRTIESSFTIKRQ